MKKANEYYQEAMTKYQEQLAGVTPENIFTETIKQAQKEAAEELYKMVKEDLEITSQSLLSYDKNDLNSLYGVFERTNNLI